MKKIFAPCFLLTSLLLLLLSSCSKSDDNAGSSFTWNYKGVSYTALYTRVSSIEDLGPNIRAGIDNSAMAPGSGPSFKIIPLTAGLYAVGPGENYAGFVDTEGFNLPVAGILQITSVSNKKLSATFTLEVGPAGNQHTLTGIIRNVPITP